MLINVCQYEEKFRKIWTLPLGKGKIEIDVLPAHWAYSIMPSSSTMLPPLKSKMVTYPVSPLEEDQSERERERERAVTDMKIPVHSLPSHAQIASSIILDSSHDQRLRST